MTASQFDYKYLDNLQQKKNDHFMVLGMALIIGGTFLTVIGTFLNPTIGIIGMYALPVVFVIGFGLAVYGAMLHGTIVKVNKRVLEQFASSNGLTYAERQIVGKWPGTIFSIGNARSATNVIQGQFLDLPFATYKYSYITGSQKNTKYFDLQVVEFTLPRSIPQFVIDSLVEPGNANGSISTLPIRFKESQRINLEGDFSTYFALYAPDQYGISALTILAPDVMHVLMEHAATCDIEIVNNKLYFYWPDVALSRAQYEKIFLVASHILQEIKDKITKSDIYKTTEQAALHTESTANGVLLKKSLLKSVILKLVIGILFFLGYVQLTSSNNQSDYSLLAAVFFFMLALLIIITPKIKKQLLTRKFNQR
jgi:hypothetical protein